ncbi:MAG: calcium-binding protein [Actinomycetota bacterium]
MGRLKRHPYVRWARAVLAVVLLWPVGVAASDAAPLCLGRRATITGGDDGVIRGTPGDDVITAHGRRYVVRAGAGDDLVCGDRSPDELHGGAGDDRLHRPRGTFSRPLFGGPGNDRIGPGGGMMLGGPGDDLIRGYHAAGGRGDDTMYLRDGGGVYFTGSPRGVHVDLLHDRATGAGRDRVIGEPWAVVGTSHADVIVGDHGQSRLLGHGGADLLVGRGGVDWLTAGPGADVIRGGEGEDYLGGKADDDRLFGGEGRDTFRPSAGDDFVDGGPGDDFISPKEGDDEVYGGPGIDTAYYKYWGADLVIDLGEGYAEGAGYDELDGLEIAHGGGGDDLIRGTDGDDSLLGNDGDDRLEGLAGDDFLGGWNDFDTTDGGPGIDTCAEAEVMIGCESVQP